MSQLFYLVCIFWPWWGYSQFPVRNMTTTLGAAGASLILCLVVWVGKKAFKIVKNDFDLKKKVIFGIVFIILGSQLYLQSPGLISFDDLELMKAISVGHFSFWVSLSYTFFAYACYFIFGSALHTSILNFILIMYFLFLFLRILNDRLPLWAPLAIVLLFGMPQTAALVLFQNRDSTSSILICCWSIGLIAQCTPSKKEIWLHFLPLFLLTVLLGDIRQDGKIFLLIFPLAIFWRQNLGRKAFLKICILVAIIWPAAYWLPAHCFRHGHEIWDYETTAFLSPLGYIFHSKGLSAATQGEQDDLNRFFRLNYMVEFYSPVDILPFHHGGVRTESRWNDYHAFRAAALRVISRYPELYFENRLTIAEVMLNFKERPLFLSNIERDLWIPPKDFHIVPNYEYTPLQRAHIHTLEYFMFEMPDFLRIPISSCLVPILVFLSVLLTTKKFPELLFMSIANLARLIAILALAPAAYFKYITSFWVLGWILLIYIGVKIHARGTPSESGKHLSAA